MDQHEINNILFDKFRAINDTISENAASHGYSKSPDFFYKQEYLQRLKERKWLQSRGKSPMHESN